MIRTKLSFWLWNRWGSWCSFLIPRSLNLWLKHLCILTVFSNVPLLCITKTNHYCALLPFKTLFMLSFTPFPLFFTLRRGNVSLTLRSSVCNLYMWLLVECTCQSTFQSYCGWCGRQLICYDLLANLGYKFLYYKRHLELNYCTAGNIAAIVWEVILWQSRFNFPSIL